MSSSPGEQHAFATTHWSLVARAGQASSAQAQRALAALCDAYWYPLYAFVRRKGYQPAEAQDLTQAFFVELLEKDRLQLADQQRGKFRSFLLAALNNFLANQWRDAHALKRGGGTALRSLDADTAEARYRLEPAHELTPERIFERRWALTLLAQTIERLRAEYAENGKLELFELLKGHLGYGDATPYRRIGTELAMSETAVKVAAHRMRKRCGEILRDEISQTVDGDQSVDEELRELFAAVEI